MDNFEITKEVNISRTDIEKFLIAIQQIALPLEPGKVTQIVAEYDPDSPMVKITFRESEEDIEWSNKAQTGNYKATKEEGNALQTSERQRRRMKETGRDLRKLKTLPILLLTKLRDEGTRIDEAKLIVARMARILEESEKHGPETLLANIPLRFPS
ncbi:hypothetical protein DWX10_16100 [Clostridium sp. AF18-27]|uniref:hypothetical protein n=1 Tax=Enterocloster lavalensis TaxID=460384 RepID=UPI000E529303|nr:hypothetical protein [Enterocloster lavalensis]RHR51939.1 hypothetical protein DWX10_16100 [Clostridium sp. AF18-27]